MPLFCTSPIPGGTQTSFHRHTYLKWSSTGVPQSFPSIHIPALVPFHLSVFYLVKLFCFLEPVTQSMDMKEQHTIWGTRTICLVCWEWYPKKSQKEKKRKSSLPCYYTQTSLIRQQQNFINRLDIMEWACYKWALSKPYSATKWVFSVHCSHLKHHRWCRITNDCY